MKKGFRSYLVLLVACLMCLGLSIGLSQSVQAITHRGTDVTTAGNGNVMINVDGTFVTPGKDAVLNRINQIRREAYNEGLVSTYVPIKWSNELENSAQTRAVEALMNISHTRPNGSNRLLWATNASAMGENLAWNGQKSAQSMMYAIEQFYEEKADYITYKNTGRVTGEYGHYASLIDPNYRYTGLGTFYTEGVYYTATAQLFANNTNGNEAATNAYGSYRQAIEVQAGMVSGLSLNAHPTTIVVGKTAQASLSATVNGAKVTFPSIGWTSSNAGIASVDTNGLVKGLTAGTVTITAKAGPLSASKNLTVKAISHLQNFTFATKTGEAVSLPTKITATWSDGSTTQENVTWPAVDYTNKTNTAKVITLSGTVAGTNIRPTATITIHGIKSTDRPSVNVHSGTVPTLPKTVKVTWTDGSTTDEAVTWGPIYKSDYISTTKKTRIVDGTLARTTMTTTVALTVHVIESVSDFNIVATRSGQAPVLPTKVSVKWTSGMITNEPVTWSAIKASDYTSNSPKKFNVSGTVTNTHLKTTAEVRVMAITKIDDTQVTTVSGKAPTLPSTVKVTWSDGTTSNEKVTWSKLSSGDYTSQKDATVKKTGTVANTNLKANLTIKISAKSIPFYRLYNPHTGQHHYTTSKGEYDYLDYVGWNGEGIGWQSPVSGTNLYRLYNPHNGDHHYTTSLHERNHLIKVGWKDEGIAGQSGGSVPVYRLYNPNAKVGYHHYTPNKSERDYLIKVGWKDEGIGWYAVAVR